MKVIIYTLIGAVIFKGSSGELAVFLKDRQKRLVRQSLGRSIFVFFDGQAKPKKTFLNTHSQKYSSY